MSSSFSICRARSRAMCNFAKRKRNRRKPVHFAEPKCAQNAAEDRSRRKPMHFRCKAQMCTTEAEETNAFPMQNPYVHNRGRRNHCISDAKPKCANFSVCTEKARSTKMHFNGEIPSARCKCARMPDAIQCSKLKTQSIQMQYQLQFSAAAVQKKPIHDAAIFCRTRWSTI